MEFLKTNPLFALTIILLIVSPIVGWSLLRRVRRVGNYSTLARIGFVSGAAFIVYGVVSSLVRIGMRGESRFESGIVLGLLMCWSAWILQRVESRGDTPKA